MKKEEMKVLMELQSFGLTQGEILSIPENDRENLLAALYDAEERDVPYTNLIQMYLGNYGKFKKFEDFLRPKKFY